MLLLPSVMVNTSLSESESLGPSPKEASMNKQLKRGLARLLASDVNLQSFTFKREDLAVKGIDNMKVTVGYCEEFFVESDKSALIAAFRKKFKELCKELSSMEELLGGKYKDEVTFSRSEIMK